MLARQTGLSCFIYFGQHLRAKQPRCIDTVGQRNCYVLWLQTDGISLLENDHEQWALNPGEVFLAEPGVRAKLQGQAHVIRVVFDLIYRERTVDRKGKMFPTTWTPQPDWLTLFGSPWQPQVPEPWARRAREVIPVATMENPVLNPEAWLVANQKLGLWVANYAHSLRKTSADGLAHPPSGHHFIKAAEAILHGSLDPKPSISDIAKQLGVSRGHLNRIFKEVRGYGPGHARLVHQIATAKGLLLSGRSIQQTARLCGFNSLSGFRDAFTRMVGIRPHEWIAEQRTE